MNQSTIMLLTLQQEYIKYKFNKKKRVTGGSIQELYIIIRLRAFEHTNSSKELPIFGH